MKKFVVLSGIILVFISIFAYIYLISDKYESNKVLAVDSSKGFVPNFENINKIIGLSKSDILAMFGNDYQIGMPDDTGEASDFESYIYNQIGLNFIFEYKTEFEDNPSENKILFLECGSNTDIHGAKPGMSFKQIQDILGKNKIKTWDYQMQTKQYSLRYDIGNCTIQFIAFNEDGTGSKLRISPKLK